MNTYISAIVLAAGESRRMGKLKQLLPFNGSTLIEHVVANVLTARVDEVVVVVGFESEKIIHKLAGLPVKIVTNSQFQKGLSSSIIAGVCAADSKSQALMIVLADQPDIDSSTINRLIEAFLNTGKEIVVPVYQGSRGHPVIFSTKYKGELLKLTGDSGGRQIIEQNPANVLSINLDSAAILRDIDTAEDYRLSSGNRDKI